VFVEFGSGTTNKQGRVTVDKVDLSNVDIVADIENGLPFLPDNSVNENHCRSVPEHIENFENLIGESVINKSSSFVRPTFLHCLVFNSLLSG
jgi:hypothetical protein